jgi:hypothetical protein
MTENFFYFIGTAGTGSAEEWLNLLFIRSVFTAYMHSAATATFGAGISRLKNRGWRALTSVIFFYAVAVALHASWNALLSVGSREAGGWAILILLFYFSLIFLLFTVGIRNERKQREKILEEEFASGILPLEFKNSLFSYRAMRKNNWFPSQLNKENYLSLVSRLAMRKSDYAKAGEKRRIAIDEEIAQIRQELKRYSDLISQIPK